jgi:hypothetical protein
MYMKIIQYFTPPEMAAFYVRFWRVTGIQILEGVT